MPSALETLVKILKLEQNTGFQETAVIGGFEDFAAEWAVNAHAQAKKPEHHALVDELTGLIGRYSTLTVSDRPEAVRYMLGRITGRISPPSTIAETPLAPSVPPIQAATPTPAIADPEERRDPPPLMPQSTGRRPPDKPQRTERQANAGQPVRQQPTEKLQRFDKQRAEKTNITGKSSDTQETRPPKRKADSLSEFGARDFREAKLEPIDPIIEEPYDRPTYAVAEPEPSFPPPSLDDLVFEPIPGFEIMQAADAPGDLLAIRPPRARQPAPRRRRDTRTLEDKLRVLSEIAKPANTLPGIGPKMVEKLESAEIRTVQDLLFMFPRRYDDYTAMKPINRLRPGELVSVAGTVRSAALIKGKRNIDVFNVVIDDGAGVMTASFFNQAFLRTKISKGDQIVISGKTDLYNGRLTMSSPHWEFLDQDALTTRTIVPVYPLTASLSANNMRRATDIALELWGEALPDAMPDSVLERAGLAEYSWALRQLHRPDSMDMLEHGRERLMFDDLILLQIGVLRNRRAWQALPADPLPVDDGWIEGFKDSLPFPLTGAQRRAIAAIRDDIAKPIPMNRLLQGDVGAGKTVVAAAALAMAITNGHQAAIMAPTGILAEQHFRGLSRLLAGVPGGDTINIKLLTSATSNAERSEILWGLGEGTVQLVIGTHALIQEDVNFRKLGVAVIDEQHRFGVEQRGKLRGKGKHPHILVMTATPIPRTLALTMYADLDLTVLDEMPPGRTPIETIVAQPRQRERLYSYIRAEVAAGRQAFIVYPLVEASESEALADVKSAVEEYEKLRKEVFPELRISLLHGRMSAAEKDSVMAAFSAGNADILVSTAVVEVGIDIPNASVMLIESANRFGLAQLHQFRGRVGRGRNASYCILIADNADEAENPRLRALAETTDGFRLAEIDWQLRGPGELLGTRQSGAGVIAALAEFIKPEIVELAQAEAKALYAEDPTLSLPEHTLLRRRVEAIYGAEPNAEVS